MKLGWRVNRIRSKNCGISKGTCFELDIRIEVRCGQNQRGLLSSEVIVETLIVVMFSRKQKGIK